MPAATTSNKRRARCCWTLAPPAARRLVADATQNLTSLLKSGYSPVEQYDNESRLLQGPWSDVYALSAVLYTAAIGRVPKAALARLVRDDLVSARVAGKGRYSQSFLAAIDAGLAVRPEQRPQSMAAWWECFNRPEPPAPDRTVPVHAVTAPDGVVDLPLEPPAQPKPGTRWWYVAAVVAVGALALALFGRR